MKSCCKAKAIESLHEKNFILLLSVAKGGGGSDNFSLLPSRFPLLLRKIRKERRRRQSRLLLDNLASLPPSLTPAFTLGAKVHSIPLGLGFKKKMADG